MSGVTFASSATPLSDVGSRIKASRSRLEKLQAGRLAGSKLSLQQLAKKELFYAVKLHKDVLEAVAPGLNPAHLLAAAGSFLADVDATVDEQ